VLLLPLLLLLLLLLPLLLLLLLPLLLLLIGSEQTLTSILRCIRCPR